jgi:hypothetical protein
MVANQRWRRGLARARAKQGRASWEARRARSQARGWEGGEVSIGGVGGRTAALARMAARKAAAWAGGGRRRATKWAAA